MHIYIYTLIIFKFNACYAFFKIFIIFGKFYFWFRSLEIVTCYFLKLELTRKFWLIIPLKLIENQLDVSELNICDQFSYLPSPEEECN